MKNKGLLIVFSGPSGSGKGTILHDVLEQNPSVMLSVSATTRSPREGEQDGVNYFFLSKNQFEQLSADGGMLEHACYCGNYYGTPRKPVEEALKNGKDVILEIEVQGALQIKQKFPECVTVFILPPSMEVLESRLRRRQTEDEETIQKRLAKAKEELTFAKQYDYVVVNGELKTAVDDMQAILRAEHCRAARNEVMI
ncbi:MAG: guanylate kinase [Firmicutes bacterium]|nr:guanylate kinase [Bacillota bacterium]